MCWPSEDLQISSDQGSDHVFFCVCAVYSCEDECSCVWLTLYLQIEARGWCQCWKSSLTILHFTFWKISHWTWIDLRLANQQAQGYFVSASLALGLQACATISGFYMGSEDLNSGPTLLWLELYRLSHLPNPLVVFFENWTEASGDNPTCFTLIQVKFVKPSCLLERAFNKGASLYSIFRDTLQCVSTYVFWREPEHVKTYPHCLQPYILFFS